MGAANSSPSKANELLAAAATAAPYADTAGITPQELLAGTAINATILDPEGGASKGGTAMRSYLRSLGALRSGQTEKEGGIEVDEEGHILSEKVKQLRGIVRAALQKAGPGLIPQSEAIERLNLDQSQLQKVLAQSEAFTGYRNILNNRGDVGKSLQDQAAAQRGGLFDKTLHLTEVDPNLLAAKNLRIETAADEDAMDKAGLGRGEQSTGQLGQKSGKAPHRGWPYNPGRHRTRGE